MATVASIYAKYGDIITAYHGNYPIGFFCAAILEESGGRQICSGDDPNGETSCGGQGAPLYEYGLAQVSSNQEKRFGINGSLDGLRKSVEGNIWLSSAENNTNAAINAKRYGLDPGSPDVWLISYMVFAIGQGGVDKVIADAKSQGYWDKTHASLATWANDGNAFQINNMPASTIKRRVIIPKTNWDNGVAAGVPMSYGPPFLVPPPGGRAWQIPAEARGLISVGQTDLVTLALLVAGGYLFMKTVS